MYEDQRNSKDLESGEKKILKKIWNLLDEADVVIGHNSKKFDRKKLNAKFIKHGFLSPSSYKQIDTLDLVKKHFAFASNKLEALTEELCTVHKKSKHKKFPGFELWKECLLGNIEAWKEMEQYNKEDVFSLEELYKKLIAWDDSINFNLYTDSLVNICKCTSVDFKKNGFYYTGVSKFQRWKCIKCGSETRDRKNLFDKEKMKSLRVNTVK